MEQEILEKFQNPYFWALAAWVIATLLGIWRLLVKSGIEYPNNKMYIVLAVIVSVVLFYRFAFNGPGITAPDPKPTWCYDARYDIYYRCQ